MQELAPAIAELEKRPDLNLDVALVVGRLACVALCISAVMTGNSLLAWFAVPVLLWTLLVVWGQRVVFLENLNSLPRIAPASDAGPPSGLFPAVSVISPARNEEKGIEPALRSLALQDYPRLEFLAIDDHSTDTTPVILQRLEGACAASARFARRMGRKTARMLGGLSSVRSRRRVVVIY
jgi:cellulose synthase/poly-beta-1,6-N-acetylglucosamine synthase-like glycosyltransferase